MLTLKYRRIRGDMIEVYKLLMSKYDDDIVHLDINIDTRTRGHTKKLVVKRCHYDVRKYSFCIRVLNSTQLSFIKKLTNATIKQLRQMR